MSYNWKKLELLRVRHNGDAKLQDGSAVKHGDSMVYLGGLLAADGQASAELARRVGMAKSDFNVLETVWKHANISRKRKVEIHMACVVQKLLYCLNTLWLNKSMLRKLDGFHARCLRRICGVEHAYLSRVSNAQVLAEAKAEPLSVALRVRQLLYCTVLVGRAPTRRIGGFISTCLARSSPSAWAIRCI